MKTITIAGRTGKPAEIRRTNDGTPVLAFSVAVDDACSVEGCRKPVKHRGWCAAHYTRWYNHGSPLLGGTPNGEPSRFIDETASRYDGSDCLAWPFERSGNGYPLLRHKGRKALAHRVVCEIVHGPPPSPLHQAAHECGGGAAGCVNPNHLSWKTQAENEADKVKHGTDNRGERCGTAKLTEADVKEIRRVARDHTQSELANRFSVSRVTISDITRGKSWTHLIQEGA